MDENSGQVTGSISEAAFSFMVHEPKGIIEWQSERSRDSSRLIKRSIWVSLRWAWKTASDINAEDRTNDSGQSDA